MQRVYKRMGQNRTTVTGSINPGRRSEVAGATRQPSVTASAVLCAAAACAISCLGRSAFAQNTADNVLTTSTTTALDATGTYSLSALPGTSNDLVFTSGTAYNSQFTLNTSALTPGTLDDLNTTALNIVGSQSFNLSGGLNSVAPNTADLLYVASGGNMNLSAPVLLVATGNFDAVGTLKITTAISGSGVGFSKVGTGALTLSSGASTFSGGVNLSGGTINLAASSTGAAGAVTSGPLGTGTVTLNGATLSTVSGNETINNAINANSGTTILGSVSGSGNLILGGALTGTGTLANNTTGTASSIYFQGNLSGFQGTFNFTTYSTSNIRFGSGSNQMINASQGTFNVSTGSGSTRNVAINDTYTNDIFEMGALTGNGVIEGSFTGSANTYAIGYLNTNTTFSGRFSDNTGSGQAAFSVLKAGTGSLTLSATNSQYTGTTTVENGTLIAGASSASGSAGAFGSASSAIALGDANSINSNLSTGLMITGVGVNVGRAITVGANTNSTTGTYTIGGASANTGTLSGNISLNQSLLVSEASGGTLTVSGIIGTNNGAIPTVNFTGPGSVNLSATNTYTGATTVSGGTLTLTAGGINSTGGITINGTGARFVQTSASAVTPAITVTNGTLDGTTAVGAVTVSSGTGGIVTNGNGTTGPLTVGSLTYNGGGTLTVNLAGGSNTSAGIVDTGTLATHGASTVTVNATESSAWNPGTTYTLLSYGGTYTGSAGTNALAGVTDFLKGTIGGLSGRESATLNNTGSTITLSIAGDFPKWTGQTNITGASDANWTTTTGNLNWKLNTGGTATDFLTNDSVLFDDSATGPTTVNISSANVSPVSVTFNNSNLSYTISSTGGFGIATGSLLKNGTGPLTITSSNAFSGGTTLNAGTLNIGNASALGTGTVTIAGGAIDNTSGSPITLPANNAENWNGNFTFNGTNAMNLGTGTITLGASVVLTNNGSLTVGGNIGGAYGLTVAGTGAGTLILSGDSTYSGGTTLNTGTLDINSSNAIGTGTFNIAGGTIDNTSSGGAITLANNNVQNWNVSFTFTGTNALNLGTGAVTLGTPVTVTTNGSTLTVGGAIGGAFSLTKAGSGTLVLNAAGTYSGGTNLSGGTLTLGASSTPTSGTITSGPVGTGTLTLGGGTLNANTGVTIGNTINLLPSTTTDLQTSSITTNQNLVLNGNISGSGNLEVIAVAGLVNQVQLGGNNDGSFTGTLTQDTGNTALQFNAATAGSATAAFVINNSSSQRLKFNFGLGTINFGSLSGSGFLANVAAAAGTATVSVGALNTSTGFSGVLQYSSNADPVALLKVGTGTLTLSGINTFIGGTTVNQGTLVLAHGGGSGAIRGSLTINPGATVSTTVLDALGFSAIDGNGNPQAVSTINIIGGLLDNAWSGNEGFITNFNLTGGTMSATGGGAYNLNVNATIGTVAGIASNANSSTSVISAPLVIRSGGILNITTALGTTSSGIDLSISGAISQNQGVNGIALLGTGTTQLTGSNTYTGGTNVSAGTLIFAAPGSMPNFTGLTIGSGALVNAANHNSSSPKNTLFASSLSIAGTAGNWLGKLDLANNDMVVQNGSLTQLTNQVAQGYSGGTWNGSGGIVSTAAASNSTHLTALGVIQNSVDGTTTGSVLYGSFDGATASAATDVLLKYTYYGDTDLSGVVDGTDYSRIDNAYLFNQTNPSTPLTGWFNGDFNYDGVVDGSDYTLIDNAFNSQGSQIAAEIATPTAQIAGGAGSAAVPEPTTLGLLGIGAIGLLGRRNRRRK